ncbi:MAG: PHP domain-containing protein [Chlamydiales bacterium]
MFPTIFRADLHCHSNCSDGSDSPQELIDIALKEGLCGLSITDHDTIRAYETAVPYAAEKGLLLLSGVEFSSSHAEEPIHILGYAFSLQAEPLQALCRKHRMRRRERNLEILANLKRMGITIEEEELGSSDTHTVGRPHIALLLIERGEVSTVQEAFARYLGEEKPAYASGEIISIDETIKAIHQSGGKAILAHPQLIKRKRVFRKMLEMPFDGLEGYYAHLALDQEERYLDIAKERGFLITGGSDYHGAVKPNNRLGSSWVDQETFTTLYNHYVAKEKTT